MFDNMQPIEVGWYDWDYRLAAVVNNHAFVLNDSGWHSVNPADVSWDGRRFANAKAAIEAFRLTWDGIDPTVVASHIARGLAPPKPRRFCRFILINDAVTILENDQLSSQVIAEFDDGWMRGIDDEELVALIDLIVLLDEFRSARSGYWRI